MSGGNSLVSVEEVLQSERKLRMKGLLKMYSRSKGNISVKDFLTEVASSSEAAEDKSFIDNFPFQSIDLHSDLLTPIIYVAGYVAKKNISKLVCELLLQCNRRQRSDNSHSR